MPKRKGSDDDTLATEKLLYEALPKRLANGAVKATSSHRHLQIVTGSYEKVLHGFIATFSKDNVEFNDNFLFSAHGSAIRCLAISPQGASEASHESGKLILASGGTDERINLYHISNSMPDSPLESLPKSPFPSQATKFQNPRNKELGSLSHHASSVNVLHFPSRTKLLSAADDNTIAISRTRDWTVLSTIKVPVPRIAGRPSGDTAPPGAAPSGVNDFAVHPSQKIMISVGKGEKCMRLWNLVAGKKAGVLSFEKELLQSVGESKWSKGEGRRVEWNGAGTAFAVAFERGVVIFGLNSEPKGIILPDPPTKVHQLHFIKSRVDEHAPIEVLTVSTDDGRVLFYTNGIGQPISDPAEAKPTPSFPIYPCVGSLGGKKVGLEGRIKDFECLDINFGSVGTASKVFVTAGSDGVVRLWHVSEKELVHQISLQRSPSSEDNRTGDGALATETIESSTASKVGTLLGAYETGNRITCMKAFELRPPESERFETREGEEGSFEGFE